MKLQTSSLKLGLCCLDDAADFMELERDPEVMRFLNGGRAVDHTREHPDATFLMPRGTENYVWTARRSSNCAFVGWFCLWPENETVAELGYRLRRKEWGQGLASEGAAALVNWAFRNRNYNKIFASTGTVNHASRRVLEKVGMSYVRTINVDWPKPFPGSEHGEVEYEIVRRNWKSA
jgi:RimJ/RimL family protein N-acetyltransferase